MFHGTVLYSISLYNKSDRVIFFRCSSALIMCKEFSAPKDTEIEEYS